MATDPPADPPLPVFVADPYAYYRRLRSQAPVQWDDALQGWLLTRYADVAAILRDPRFVTGKTFTRNNQFPDLQQRLGQWMIHQDPPQHTRLRALVNKAFTPRMVDGLRPYMEQAAGKLLDPLQPTGRMELIADLAFPLPVQVIALMLGVPAEDHGKFRDWARAIDHVLEPASLIGPEVYREGDRALGELTEFFRRLADQRRQAPQEDLVSALVGVEAEGQRLSTDELLAMCILILFAGHATTVNLIGNGVLTLLRHPDQWELLRNNPHLVESAVEELLRYDSSIQMTSRVAAEDVEIGGQKVGKGQEVLLLLGAANRDPERFPDPDRVDITRADNRHLAFGGGIHYCLGAPLARAEAQVVFTALAQRMPNLRLATDQLEYQQTVTFRALKALPVVF